MTARKHLQNNSTFSGWKNKINQQTALNCFQAQCEWRGTGGGPCRGEEVCGVDQQYYCFFLNNRKWAQCLQSKNTLCHPQVKTVFCQSFGRLVSPYACCKRMLLHRGDFGRTVTSCSVKLSQKCPWLAATHGEKLWLLYTLKAIPSLKSNQLAT